MDRRIFIRMVGGGMVVGAGAPGLAACGPDLPDPAAAWRRPGTDQADDRLFALSHGVLAPNPHNRQPWKVRLEGSDAVLLHVDRDRLLPATDPFSRQIIIGCGAFIELTAVAASARGRSVRVDPFPEGSNGRALDDRPVARLTFASGGSPDPLFTHITARRSNKAPFDPRRALDPDAAERVQAAATGAGLRAALIDDHRLPPLRKLVDGAYRREMETPAAFEESVQLMRIGRREIAAHRDGISIAGPAPEVMAAVGLLSREQIRKPGSAAHKQGLGLYRKLADSTPAFLCLMSDGNDRPAQLASGRGYARMALTAQALGVALHPVSQALQEYAEVAGFKRDVDALTGVRAGERLQMLVRAGYGGRTPPSPRRGLQDHLVT